MTSIIVLLGDPQYAKGIQHWANYTSQAAICVVEPGTAGDVGIIVNLSFFRSFKQLINFPIARNRWEN